MNEQEIDDRDTLSECHRDYMARYVAFELLRASESLLKLRASRLEPERLKARLRGL
jgi:hypothetical protein